MANTFLLQEFTMRMCEIFVVQAAHYQFTALQYTMVGMTTHFFLYVHEASSIVALVVLLTCQIFIGDNIVYQKPLTMQTAVMKVFVILMSFIGSSLFSIVPIYVRKLQTKLITANKQQKKLLNGMHEGLLIIDEKIDRNDKLILFLNKPVEKLLKLFANLGLQSDKTEEYEEIDFLEKDIFEPIH